MLLHSASQLLTLAGPPQRGQELGRLAIIPDGAVLIRDGKIAAVGTSEELKSAYPSEEALDVSAKVVLPGFVDPHTHLVWAGDRAAEFEMRLEGKTYLEILETGGGILSTVNATRKASTQELIESARSRLWQMFYHGTTTAEAKTGYGLELETELRMLDALQALDSEGPWDLALTFLGAHAIPNEFAGKTDEYTSLVCESMLPALLRWSETQPGQNPLPFVDVFCETGAFNLEQSRRILETAQDLGFPLKIHADEFDNLGGTQMAAEMGAASADHLVSVSDADIRALAQSDTVAVGLPGTPFGLAESKYTPARKILEAGGLLAIASDLNPGTAWGESMQFAIALACRYMRLIPAQAIAAATINAAAAIERHEMIGSIEVGKLADLLVLDVPDFRHLGYRFGINLVQSIIKEGEIFAVKG
ncbi:MAG: imidazolonepropionase [Chloroflexi bacterium]|nr:imidazolonepropionase [Chloroflexota bacterium]